MHKEKLPQRNDMPKRLFTEADYAQYHDRVPTRLLSESQACRYLNVSRSFLAKARMTGALPNRTPGPPFLKIGRAVRYDVSDLDQWIAAWRVVR